LWGGGRGGRGEGGKGWGRWGGGGRVSAQERRREGREKKERRLKASESKCALEDVYGGCLGFPTVTVVLHIHMFN
jgi:hypothetical protein